MNRWSANLLTITFCLILAGLGTKLAFAQAEQRQLAAQPKPTPTATPTPTPMPTPTSTPTPTPTATPVPTPVQRTATTIDYVRMRAAKSTSSAVVTELQGGSVLILGPDETSLWQEAYYGQYHGYVWKGYLRY